MKILGFLGFDFEKGIFSKIRSKIRKCK